MAQVVNLDHNAIEVLRKGQLMPKQEGNILVLDLSYNSIEDVPRRNARDVHQPATAEAESQPAEGPRHERVSPSSFCIHCSQLRI